MPNIGTGIKTGLSFMGGSDSANKSNQMSGIQKEALNNIGNIPGKQSAFADAELAKYDERYETNEQGKIGRAHV